MVVYSSQSPYVNNQEGLGGGARAFFWQAFSEVTSCRDWQYPAALLQPGSNAQVAVETVEIFFLLHHCTECKTTTGLQIAHMVMNEKEWSRCADHSLHRDYRRRSILHTWRSKARLRAHSHASMHIWAPCRSHRRQGIRVKPVNPTSGTARHKVVTQLPSNITAQTAWIGKCQK